MKGRHLRHIEIPIAISSSQPFGQNAPSSATPLRALAPTVRVAAATVACRFSALLFSASCHSACRPPPRSWPIGTICRPSVLSRTTLRTWFLEAPHPILLSKGVALPPDHLSPNITTLLGRRSSLPMGVTKPANSIVRLGTVASMLSGSVLTSAWA